VVAPIKWFTLLAEDILGLSVVLCSLWYHSWIAFAIECSSIFWFVLMDPSDHWRARFVSVASVCSGSGIYSDALSALLYWRMYGHYLPSSWGLSGVAQKGCQLISQRPGHYLQAMQPNAMRNATHFQPKFVVCFSNCFVFP